MVLNNELIYMVKRFMRGFLVSKETLSVELIDEIGPSKHYLQHPMSVKPFPDRCSTRNNSASASIRLDFLG